MTPRARTTTPFVYNLRFPGQYFDAETGLSYNYFRDYDPALDGMFNRIRSGCEEGSTRMRMPTTT
jgi:RHS repeat-associated protein